MITEPSEVAVGAASGVPAVWGHVPQRNKNFTGRVGLLRELREHLTKDSTTTAVLQHALYGLGGVGKTQLAMEYAYRFQGEYEVVWWISADQPSLIRSTLASLAPHLELPATGRTDEAVAAVLDALRRGEPYRRWLLVFDNADQPETLQDFMPPGPGHVLITSRNHRWERTIYTIEVDVFSRAESLEFLHRRMSGITDSDADRLAEELGDVPLALEQAGKLRAENPPTGYRQGNAARQSQRDTARTGRKQNDRPAARLFVVYSHKDEKVRERLWVFLAPLRHQGLISSWDDRQIIAGSDWESEVLTRLDEADIIGSTNLTGQHP